MITRLEVHHQISGDVTNSYEFSLLFNLEEILNQLASLVKAPTVSSLRVFASPDAAAKETFLGDRFEGIIAAMISNRMESVALLEAGGYRFNSESSTVVVFLRVDNAMPVRDDSHVVKKRRVLYDVHENVSDQPVDSGAIHSSSRGRGIGRPSMCSLSSSTPLRMYDHATRKIFPSQRTPSPPRSSKTLNA